MLDQISTLCLDGPNDCEVVMVGDFNLSDVLWDCATVVCPDNTKDKKFILQKKFLDKFAESSLYWQLIIDGTITRRRMYNCKLQDSLLDQVLVTEPALIMDTEVSQLYQYKNKVWRHTRILLHRKIKMVIFNK